MSLYSWIFGEEVEVVPEVTTIEQMITSHGETKSQLEVAENVVAKLKADLETLRIAISNRLESEKNRITCNPSESLLITPFDADSSVSDYQKQTDNKMLAKKPTAQPMFY
jgi:hypothetical protein